MPGTCRSWRISPWCFHYRPCSARLAEAGVLSEDDRVELIEGEIIDLAPIGSRHAGTVDELNYLIGRALPIDCRLRVQNPLRLTGANEPQPDLAIVRNRSYAAAHPGPGVVTSGPMCAIHGAHGLSGQDRGTARTGAFQNGEHFVRPADHAHTAGVLATRLEHEIRLERLGKASMRPRQLCPGHRCVTRPTGYKPMPLPGGPFPHYVYCVRKDASNGTAITVPIYYLGHNSFTKYQCGQLLLCPTSREMS
ncbi:Uma2 family endonuclease [Candidatus Methylocalor cossyra]|uniref:Uma2 family endonuclease n=1 Tax=Candidatus Methylocalor cossyra TaxID=3108543 RepID=UPI003D6C79E6